MTTTGKQIFSTLAADGTLTVEVGNAEFAQPTGRQVLVKDGSGTDQSIRSGPAVRSGRS